MTEEDTPQKGCVEYIISEEDFKTVKELKNDRFGRVELVKRKPAKKEDGTGEVDTSDYVRIQLSKFNQPFVREVDYFVHTDIHPSIVQFEGYEYYPDRLAVTKYYSGGSLQHLLKEAREGRANANWNGTMKSICAYGVVSAVTHLHNIYDETEDDFSIRYLCPENIIFEGTNPRLINYVFGKVERGTTPNAYIPPELHENPNGPRYDEDIWAIGMILYEILTGHQPFQGKSEAEIKTLIMNGDLPEFPPKSPETDDIIGIIQNCLEKKPTDRPLPYMLYAHLTNLSEPLFPGTDKNKYDNYRKAVSEATVQSIESSDYINKPSTTVDDKEDVFQKAEEGDLFSLVKAGRIYQKGIGVPKDEAKGFEYYMRAADEDYSIGLFNASLCLSQGRGCKQDKKKALELMKRAADGELENAVSEYACMVRDGVGTKPDMKKAIKILEDGCEKNYKQCQYILGNMYYDGNEVIKKDIGKALSLLRSSASNGCATASSDIAVHYYNLGLKDRSMMEKAINLFKKAARQKAPTALLNLGRIYKEGKFIDKNEEEACMNFEKAAKENDVQGMVEYAICLKNGIGCKKDVKKALTYYQRAAEKEDKRAMNNYAKLLYDGDKDSHIEKDIKTASRFFKKAADKGVPPSMYYYAKILINGEGGVIKNQSEGKKYLNMYVNAVPKAKQNEGTEELLKKVSH